MKTGKSKSSEVSASINCFRSSSLSRLLSFDLIEMPRSLIRFPDLLDFTDDFASDFEEVYERTESSNFVSKQILIGLGCFPL